MRFEGVTLWNGESCRLTVTKGRFVTGSKLKVVENNNTVSKMCPLAQGSDPPGRNCIPFP